MKAPVGGSQMSKNPKFKYSGFHYDDSVDTFVRCHFADSYVAVLFDVNRFLSGSNTDEILEFKKRYKVTRKKNLPL